jgi:hypothetical protein
MEIKLTYQVTDTHGNAVELEVQQLLLAVPSQKELLEWCWSVVRNQRWEFVSQWILEVDKEVVDIPEWGLKFVHTSVTNGFAIEDGGVEESVFWLTKPFVSFTAEELSSIEREWSHRDDNCVYKAPGMHSGGVLMDGLPTGAPVIELSVYVRDVLPYSR